MNYAIISRVIGRLMLFVGAAMVPSLLIAGIKREADFFAFSTTILLLLILGFSFSFFSKNLSKKSLKIKDALTIVSLGWIVSAGFGALPFTISGVLPNYFDAFFEAVSGFTTTGATVIDNVEILPAGLLFWRSFMHWLGGMGILVLALAIMPTVGVGGFQLFKAESPGPIADKVVPKMKDTAKLLYTAYFGITAIQTILLLFGGMTLYEALIHTFGTVGTGGFSTRNASIGAFNSSYIMVIITIFMVASGVNFSLYYALYKGEIKSFLSNPEFRVYLAIIGVAGLLVTLNIRSIYPDFFSALRHGFFQVSSIMTTTGYGTADFDLWPTFSRMVLFFLMFVGGCAGSTGGSIKVIRIMILFKMFKREVSKLLHPRAMVAIQCNGKLLSTDVIAGVTGFFFLYLMLFAGGALFLSFENISFFSAVSASAACLGNIGPGFEAVGATQTYSFFSTPSKFMLSVLMLFGRLELFTFFALLTPKYWIRD